LCLRACYWRHLGNASRPYGRILLPPRTLPPKSDLRVVLPAKCRFCCLICRIAETVKLSDATRTLRGKAARNDFVADNSSKKNFARERRERLSSRTERSFCRNEPAKIHEPLLHCSNPNLLAEIARFSRRSDSQSGSAFTSDRAIPMVFRNSLPIACLILKDDGPMLLRIATM
jgi:hypothetical protein